MRTIRGIFIFLMGMVLASIINQKVFAESDLSSQLQEKLKNAIVLYIDSPKAYVNSNEEQVDAENSEVCPVIKEGKTLVPVRFISEAIGAKVDWDGNTSTATITLNGKTVKLVIGSKRISINNIESELDVPAQVINERTFIPLRALVEALGKKIFWDDRGLIVISDNEKIFDTGTDSLLINELVSDIKPVASGNTIGNINNQGVVTKSGDWIYYSNMFYGEPLYKVNIYSSEKVKVMNDKSSYFLNVEDDWAYYTTINDNKIYKIDVNGNNKTILVNEKVFALEVVDGWVYYTDFDGNLYSIKTDGSKKIKIINEMNVTGFSVLRDWIYYSSRDKRIIGKIKVDGTENTPLLENVETNSIFITKDNLFFCNIDLTDFQNPKFSVFKSNLDGTNTKEMFHDVAEFNIDDDWIYYGKATDGGRLYKMKLDGSENKKLNENMSYNINIVGDWVYYLNEDDSLWRIKKDGTGEEKIALDI